MPSLFEELFADARETLMGFHGTSVSYAEGDAAALPVTAIVGAVAEDLIELPVDGGKRVRYRHRPLTVSLAEVPNPKRPDKFTIDGETWTVHERLPQDGGMARLTVVRPVRIEGGGRSASR